jgi:KipI family sensor histidine kinase inhibitor
MGPNFVIEPLGEGAFLLRNLGEVPAYAVAQALARNERILEAAPAYDTVGVFVGPDFRREWLEEALRDLSLDSLPEPKLHAVPVCYELGEDLAEAAGQLGMTADELAERHSALEYRCYAVGFAPGFPFLGYLPPELAKLSRRASPRQAVPAGSVGVTGRQTGIYATESPGGWNLIGRTPLEIVCVEDAYFPIAAGDRVRFQRIEPPEFEKRKGERL